MNHPTIMQANAQLRYDDMLDTAERHRRVRRLTRHNHGLRARLQSLVTEKSINISDWFKVRRSRDAGAAVFHD
jgi:hypothetical protein